MDNLTLSAALDMSYRPHCDWLQIEIRSECYKKAGGKSNKKPTPLVCGISIYKIFSLLHVRLSCMAAWSFNKAICLKWRFVLLIALLYSVLEKD